MTQPDGGALAFKAQEIEELADVYFFRPVGMVFALAARRLRLTPSHVTLIAMLVGMAGGALMYDARYGYVAFALLIAHGVLDSSDGQLARMTGQASEFGRMLDGISGYGTHAVLYIALVTGLLHQIHQGTLDRSVTAVVLSGIAAILASIVQAQTYDYHRNAYARYAIAGLLPAGRPAGRKDALARPARSAISSAILGRYEAMEARLAGLHPEVERRITARSRQGRVRNEDRARYRTCFYWPVRGWNLFGDNTRFYAIGVVAWLKRPDWFLMFLVGPMTVAFVIVWLWQMRADRRFLEGL